GGKKNRRGQSSIGCIPRRSENAHSDHETDDNHGKRKNSQFVLFCHGLKIVKKHSILAERNEPISMKKNLLCLLVYFSIPVISFSQQKEDSSKTLSEVFIKAYEQNRKLIEVAAPVSFTGQTQLNRFNTSSILSAVNITPGVRMEERSPASYRLNIRGSSL